MLTLYLLGCLISFGIVLYIYEPSENIFENLFIALMVILSSWVFVGYYLASLEK